MLPMALVQVIILLMVVLFYVTDSRPGGRLPAPPGAILAVVALSLACLVALAFRVTQTARRRLYEEDSAAISARVDRFMANARWATVLLTALQLWGIGWGQLVLASPTAEAPATWGLRAYRHLMVPQAMLLAGPMLAWLGLWAAQYRVEVAVRQRSMPYRLAAGLPIHDPPTRWAYVVLQARQNLFLLVPVAIATVVEGCVEHFLGKGPIYVATSLAVVIALLLMFPWIMTRIWSTTPLTGTLRAQLEAAAARYRLRFSNILIWRTHHLMPNAAIVGYLPFARFFLMTDALLESLTDRQIESVFAHELGHGKHRHLWWYAAAMGGAFLGIAGIASLSDAALAHLPKYLQDQRDDLQTLLQLGLLGAFMMWVFSPISQRFEHQADLFAGRHIGETLPEAESAAEATQLQQGCAVFSSALLHVVRLTGRATSRGDWMHPSPAQRVSLLQDVSTDEAALRQFNRSMRRTRWFILGLLLVGLLLAAGGAAYEVMRNVEGTLNVER